MVTALSDCENSTLATWKSKKKAGSVVMEEEEEEKGKQGNIMDLRRKDKENDVEDDNVVGIALSCNNEKFNVGLVDKENDEEGSVFESVRIGDEDEDGSVIAFIRNGVFAVLVDEEGSEATDVVKPGETDIVEGNDAKVNESEGFGEDSKNKKKKKQKSGKNAQEEDDLDRILAEQGEGPVIVKSFGMPPREEKVKVQPESVVVTGDVGGKHGEEEKGGSAAAKKRRKKKEKKAAAAAVASLEVKEEKLEEVKPETTEPTKRDVKGKAVVKRVRQMQEATARRKEYEERKAREEEERLQEEELERQAEEARCRKKEREKEKL